jgi:benzoyl-CoA reductase subunit D
MTSQCASGSGQFLENISRYLGIAQDEIGALSQQATKPEKVSSICAVLAETDVINMVSRAIKPGDILRGIHESMAERLIKLLKSIDVKRGVVMMTGGLALDAGLVKALQDGMVQQKMETKVAAHSDSLYAGAIGAALWGAFRHGKLKERGLLPKAS